MPHALRALAKSPGFTVIATLIVALGIGAATAIFSTVNALVLRPIALPEPDRLAVIWETHLERNLQQFDASVPNYTDWAARNRSWQSLAASTGRTMNLTGGTAEPELLQVRAVTATFLPTLGLTPALGRNFRPEEDRPGSDNVALVSTAFAQRHFGSARAALDQTLTLNGAVYTIVGVLPPGPSLPFELEVAVPLAIDPAKEQRLNHYIEVYGRLKPGVTLAAADVEMQTLAAQIWAEHPELERGWSTTVVPLERELVRANIRNAIYLLLGAVALLLLIACANLSNLMLVRATARAHEFAIRTALGASRWAVARHLLRESLLVTIAGGALGVVLVVWALDALRSLPLPRAGEISLDARVLAVACLATLLTGLAASIGPALRASQSRPQEALKSRAPRSGNRSRVRDALVVTQIALSLTLLVGAALLVRSFWRLLHVNPGFNAENVLTLALRPNEKAVEFYNAVEREVARLPGVTHVGSISRLPLASGNTQNNVFPVGPAALAPGQSVQASWRLIHGDYFGAMQIPLLRGRDFRTLPPAEARNAMVISATLARALWGDADPLGRQIDRGGAKFTVIGVVGDVRSQQLGTEAMPAFYMSLHRFRLGPQSLVVRATGPTGPLVTALRAAIKAIDPNVPVFQIRTMRELRAASLQQERTFLFLLGGFAAAALTLAALGTYGVIAFTVQQRTSEFGIRVAIGAQRHDILNLVLGQGARLLALGLILGLVGAFTATRLLSTLVYDTPLTDPLSYLAAAFLLALAALAASWLPARRATRIDPLTALRAE